MLANDDTLSPTFRLYWLLGGSFWNNWRDACSEQAAILQSIRPLVSEQHMLTRIDWKLERLTRTCKEIAGP